MTAYPPNLASMIEKVATLTARAEKAERELAEAREALFRIAFDPDCHGLLGDPSTWPSVIAYCALGGRMADGVNLDDEATLRALVSKDTTDA